MTQHLSLERQRYLLQREYEYEKQQFERDTQLMGVDRKVKRGDCWFPISVGRSYYNSLNRLVVEVTRQADVDISHNFEYGRQVVFFSEDFTRRLTYAAFQGTVSFVDADRMVIELPSERALTQLQGLERCGVQLHFDDYSYRLQLEALAQVQAAKGNRLAELRDLLHGTAPLHWGAASAVPLRLPWLNAAQEAAVSEVLRAKDVMVVHGPPGTGKTTTLVEAISEVLRREPQCLVCAQSNTAVDWICSQLADRGLRLLRIGNPTRVSEAMWAHTYERRFADHPDYPTLWQVRRTMRQLYALPRRSRGNDFAGRMAKLREKADELECHIRRNLFDASRVIACTLTGAGHALLKGLHFHTLFIDEAAQALEAACWIAMAKADRVVLAGDHCQLPPTVKSREALQGGLANTLMQRLAEQRPEAVRLLTVQYRMNEALMRFSSDWFYGGRLQAAPEVKDRSILGLLDVPIEWVDTSTLPAAAAAATDEAPQVTAHEEFVGTGYGRINKPEAALTLQVLHDYVERIGLHRLLEERIDFGIISPYRAQVQYLRGLIRRDAALRPLRELITVNTVDAFQGQERDVVVVSLVRANAEGQIGFLSDLRRMNVAITRARYKLIILGATATLCRHAFYRKLYAAAQQARGEALPDADA